MLDGVIARVRERVPWRPGARRLLTELNDARRAVRARHDVVAPARRRRSSTSWRRSRSRRSSPATRSRRGKPHPEPYLLAADRLGVDAAECVAIEDSPTGVALGRRRRVRRASPSRTSCRSSRRPAASSCRRSRTSHRGPRRRTSPSAPRPADTVGARRRPATTADGGAGDHRRPARSPRVAAVAIAVAALGGDDDGPPPPAPGAARRARLDAVLGDRGRPAGAAGTRRARCTSCRRSGGGRPASTRSTPRPTSPADLAERVPDDRPRPRACRSWRRSSTGPTPGVMAGDPRRPGAARHATSTPIAAFAADNDFDGIDIDYEQFAFADGRDTWAATRPNWVAFVEELADAPARRRPHADGQHPAGLRRRHRVRRPRLLGVRLRARSPRTSTPSGSWPTTTRCRRASPARSPRCRGSSGSSPAPSAVVRRPVQARARHPAVRLQLGRRHGRARARPTPRATSACRRATMADLAARRGATPDVRRRATSRWRSRTTSRSPTARRRARSSARSATSNGDGAELRMQRAVDAGFGGVSLFAFGYEDEATWNAIDAISRQLEPADDGAVGHRPPGLIGQDEPDEGPPRRRHLRAVPAELRARGARSPTPARTPPRRACSTRRCSCSPTAPRTSASPATTSSRASATTCGRATRRAPACRPSCSRRSRWSRRRSWRWA